MAFSSMRTRSATARASAPPEPPSPVMVAMVGTRRRDISQEVAGDGFALAALFGADAGVGSGEVDEGEDRAAEFFGDLHGAEGLAIALGVGAAELAGDALLEGAALEVADDHDGFAVEEGHAAGHRRIVAEGAVAVDLAEVGEECCR